MAIHITVTNEELLIAGITIPHGPIYPNILHYALDRSPSSLLAAVDGSWKELPAPAPAMILSRMTP